MGEKLCEHGFHKWERELQFVDGEESVVRTCRQCGVSEVCWSPRKRVYEEEVAALET
jgi:hypothetical protein